MTTNKFAGVWNWNFHTNRQPNKIKKEEKKKGEENV